MSDYTKSINMLTSMIENINGIVNKSDLEFVTHYIDHGEYEMAFEALCLLLIERKKYPLGFNFKKTKEIAIFLKLNIETVYDDEFWKKFIIWGESFTT
jgi:hypothetical protein